MCWYSSMNLPTEVARQLFLYGPSGGKRVTSVSELARQSGASQRAIYEHLPRWRRESEELAINSNESGLVLRLSSAALEAHKSDCDFLRREVNRLKRFLRGISPADEGYPAASRSLVAMQKQWAAMSGVQAALDAAGARLRDKERAEGKREMVGDSGPASPCPEALGRRYTRKGDAAPV